MKKNLLLLASVATVALSGCSNEEIANVETSMQNAIGFNVVGSNPGTRANPVTNGEDLKKNDFFVFAFETGKTGEHVDPFMGTHATEWSHQGVEIIWNNDASKWDYKNPEELAYWPTVGLDFYAVTPSKAADLWLIHSNSQQVQYTLVDEFSDNHKQDNVDLMYATAFNRTKESNSGKVTLQFKHALSQVVFRARTEKEGMEVVVGKMKLYNVVIGTATFTFPKENESVTAANNWKIGTIVAGAGSVFAREENAENTTVVYAADSDNATWLSDVKTDKPGESNVLMMLPQTLTKWATVPGTPVTKQQADAAETKQSYLSIECSIKQNGLYVFGSADELQTLYVPFGATWEPGYRYIYTLIFGGGYDDQGNPILTPIEFDPEVTPWTDFPIDSNLSE